MSVPETATTEDLLVHSAWIRRLAQRLVGEVHSADDVVQEAWRAALAHPPATDRPLRPWLARVVRNAVRKRARGDARARSREEASARPEGLPSSAELCQRVALQRDVVQAVLALDEPWRSTIVLRYFEGLSAREIGKRGDLSEEAVRKRLERGRERLRERLDERYGDRRATCLALAALARAPVPGGEPQGEGAGGSTVGEPGSSPAGAGGPARGDAPEPAASSCPAGAPSRARRVSEGPAHGLITRRRTGHAAAAVLVAASAVWLARGGDERRDGTRDLPPSGGTAAADAPREHPGDAAASTTRSPARSAPSGAETPGRSTLIVAARFASDGAPAAGEVALVRELDADHPWPSYRTLELGDDGTARFDDLAPGEVWVNTLRAGEASERWVGLAAGATERVEMLIPEGVRVEGRVVDERGEPVPGAEVRASWHWSTAELRCVARADANGQYAVRDVQPGGFNWIGAAAPGRVPSPVRPIEDALPGDRVEVDFRLARRACEVRGRVLGPDGRPVEGALVRLGFASKSFAGARGGAPPSSARTDGRGAFELLEAPKGPQPLVVRAPGLGAWSAEVAPHPDAPVHVEVVLVPEARVHGVVWDAIGRPLAGAVVKTGPEGSLARSATIADGLGCFELRGLAAGAAVLRASGESDGTPVLAEARLALAPGVATPWSPTLTPAPRVFGTLARSDGSPLTEREVVLWLAEPVPRNVAYAQTDEAGRFAFDEVAARSHRLSWYDEEDAFPALTVEVTPSTEPVALVEPAILDAGRIAGLVRTPEGKAPAGGWVEVLHVGSGTLEAFPLDRATGALDLRVPSGECEVAVSAAGHPRLDVGTIGVIPGGVQDVGTLVLAAPAFVEGTLVGRGEEVSVAWHDASGREEGLTLVVGGAFRSPPLGEGTHRLVVQASGSTRVEREVTLAIGEVRTLDLDLAPAAVRSIAVVLPAGAVPPTWIRIALRDGEGRVMWELDRALRHPDERRFALSAPPGEHNLRVATDTGLVGEATLRFPAPGVSSPELELALAAEAGER